MDGTLEDAGRAIELDPKLANAWLHRGAARGRKGDLAGSIADLRNFLELAPDDPKAGQVRARVAELEARLGGDR